jgi:hypothetical protein
MSNKFERHVRSQKNLEDCINEKLVAGDIIVDIIYIL